MTIHHAVLKKAARLGLVISEPEFGYFIVQKDGKQIAEGPKASDVLEAAIKTLAPAKEPKVKKPKTPAKAKAAKKRKTRKSEEDGEEDEEGEDGDGGKSVITAKYKKKYRPNKDTCGDPVVGPMFDFLHPDGEDLDRAKFNQLARDNGIDPHRWDKLTAKSGAWNVGMARMNLGNVLRGMVRRGKDVQIGKTKIPGAKQAT